MTRLLLPVMNSRPKAGAVINLSSGSATAVFTGCCNYSATKVFDDVLSKSVASENTKLTFISVKPFLITSAMTYFTTGLLYCEPG